MAGFSEVTSEEVLVSSFFILVRLDLGLLVELILLLILRPILLFLHLIFLIIRVYCVAIIMFKSLLLIQKLSIRYQDSMLLIQLILAWVVGPMH